MDNLLRIAVCQLECHPSVVIADRDFLREPFPPRRSKPSLSDLARYQLDVSELQDHCASQYADWHTQRLAQVFAGLSNVRPFPDIVVLPECSIPLSDLHLLRTYSIANNAVIFAGTHTVSLGKVNYRHYDALNIKTSGKQSLKSLQGRHVLPILIGDETILHVKEVASVFENTDTNNAATGNVYHVSPIELTIRERHLKILPLVCSEALGLVSPTDQYELVTIVARHDNPAGFDSIVRTNTSNQKPVIVCNDGAFGGSAIHTILDNRMLGIWWWSPPIDGRLPPGDAILVADLNLDALTVQHGVANPGKPISLVALASITADGDKSGAYQIAQELITIASKEDNSIQLQLLEGLQQQRNPKGLSQLLIPHAKQLAKSGVLTSELAQCLLSSCILTGLTSLRGLEQELAARCAEHVTRLSDNATTDDTEALASLARFRRECKLRIESATSEERSDSNMPSSELAIDRESESRHLRQFLDHSRECVLCVTGLDDVGKETLISMTLAQSGRKNTLWVCLSSDSTLKYIAAVFARTLRFPDNAINNVRQFLSVKNTELIERIPLGTTVVITQADYLRDHGQWRDLEAPVVLADIGKLLGSRKGKLILSSTARLDIPLLEQNLLRRIYLDGLLPEFAKLLLDQQLRRVGLDPRNYTDEQRTEIVELLGGHPGAIALCADFILQDGFSAVHEDLQQRRGVHTDIVRRILKGIEFSATEMTLLSLLGEARSPLPVQVLNKAMRQNVSRDVNGLVAQGVVERGWRDFVKLPDLVRGFADLESSDNTTITLFHKAAAEELAALAKEVQDVPQLDFAIASQYHAQLAGDANLGASVPALVDGVLGSIQQLVERHQYEKAKPIVDLLLKARPSAEILQLGALIYGRLGLVDEALTLSKEAYSADSSREWIVTEVGRLALYVHRTDVASECVNLARRTGHDSPNLATLEGKIALRDGGEAVAVDAFQRAVQLTEAHERWQDAWPHFYLGRTLIKLNRPEEAIDVLYRGEGIASRKRRRNSRLLVAIRTQLAVAYIISSDFDGARRIFDLLGREESGNAEVVWAYALFRAATGDNANAVDLARDTLRRLDPSTARDRYGRCQVYLFRALVFIATGNKSQASEEFAKANQEDPRNVFVLLKWAQTLIELARQSRTDGDEHAARMCAEHAKSLADNVLRFDAGNENALQILEKLSDDFNVL